MLSIALPVKAVHFGQLFRLFNGIGLRSCSLSQPAHAHQTGEFDLINRRRVRTTCGNAQTETSVIGGTNPK
jgi:hypothetical protein